MNKKGKKKRKIGFYYLTLNNEDLNVYSHLENLLDKISNLNKLKKKFNLKNDRFCFLDKKSDNGQNLQIVFKSAKHNFRSPLLDSVTLTERDNPKKLKEGERIKTHIVAKESEGNTVLLVEKSSLVMSINQIIEYLNNYLYLINADNDLLFGYEIISKDNFLEEIEKLNRVVSTEIIVDKQILGSNALNYSNRTHSVNHEVSIKVKSIIRDSIYDFATDIYAKFNGGDNKIKRVRIVGRNHQNNEITINTDFIERQEFVLVSFNTDTGEILSRNMFIEMNDILTNFN